MRSFALWFSTKNKELDIKKEATVHVNLWNKDSNKKNYCFDIGLLLENIENIKRIYLYAPFPIIKNQI